MLLETLGDLVNPEVSAVLVVDMQNDFLDPEGVTGRAGLETTAMAGITPRLRSFIDEARRVKVPVIFIQAIYNEIYLSEPFKVLFKTKDWLPNDQRRICEEGTWGADFYGNLSPLPGELVVKKHRYSAFINTELDLVLRGQNIKSLIVTGVGTNVCVESTVRDGFMLSYYITVVEDCTATYSRQAHEASIQNIKDYFGRIATADEIVGAWKDLR